METAIKDWRKPVGVEPFAPPHNHNVTRLSSEQTAQKRPNLGLLYVCTTALLLAGCGESGPVVATATNGCTIEDFGNGVYYLNCAAGFGSALSEFRRNHFGHVISQIVFGAVIGAIAGATVHKVAMVHADKENRELRRQRDEAIQAAERWERAAGEFQRIAGEFEAANAKYEKNVKALLEVDALNKQIIQTLIGGAR